MARRRDDDDDDDDLDERPGQKSGGGGGKTVLIVLGIVGGVLLLGVAGCLGLGYWGFLSAKKSVNNSLSTFEATAEADSFLFKMAAEQVQPAYDSTSPNFKATMSRDQFQQLINRNPLLAKNTTRRAVSFNAPTGSPPTRKSVNTYEISKMFDDPEPWTPAGQPKPIKPPPGPKTITVTVTVAEQANGMWKVDGLTVP